MEDVVQDVLVDVEEDVVVDVEEDVVEDVQEDVPLSYTLGYLIYYTIQMYTGLVLGYLVVTCWGLHQGV